MNPSDAFDRHLSEWLHADAEHRVPEHLDAVLRRTRTEGQRPAWSSLERWLPMDLSARSSFFTRSASLRPIGLLVLIGLLVAVVVALAAGSRRPLPAPFGVARNGAMATSRDGDLYLIDPATSVSRPISQGNGFDFSPIFSRDGTKLVFLRSDGPLTDPAILTLFVADADGSDAHAITPPTVSLDWFDWSPDGSRIAYMANGELFVVDVAEAKPKRIPGTGRVHFPTWLPPEGNEIVYRLETTSPAIYAIAPDGLGKPRQISTTAASNKFDYQGISTSPDGEHISFTRWSSAGLPRAYALDVATGNEMPFPTVTGASSLGGAYSPDGTLVAYARINPEGGFQIVVANADGSGSERALGAKHASRRDGSDVSAAWSFTPDGTSLVVRYGDDDAAAAQLLPLDGSPATELGSGAFQFVDIQRLAP